GRALIQPTGQPLQHSRQPDGPQWSVTEDRIQVTPQVRLHPLTGLQRPANFTGQPPPFAVLPKGDVPFSLLDLHFFSDTEPGLGVEGFRVSLPLEEPGTRFTSGIREPDPPPLALTVSLQARR